MFSIFGGKKFRALDDKLLSVRHTMENNYYDAAKLSYEEALKMFKEKVDAGELTKKQIAKYQAELDEYDMRFKQNKYNHKVHAGW